MKTQLASLRREENLRKHRRKKEQTRTRFYKDSFKFLKTLFTSEKSGALKTVQKDLEDDPFGPKVIGTSYHPSRQPIN